jgi:hypothetical protein
VDQYWKRQELQNKLADIRAFRIVEALYAMAGGKSKLSPGEVFPLLEGMGEGTASEDSDGLYGADSPDLDQGERAWVQAMKGMIQ